VTRSRLPLLPPLLVGSRNAPNTLLSKCVHLAHFRRGPCFPCSCHHHTTATTALSRPCTVDSRIPFEGVKLRCDAAAPVHPLGYSSCGGVKDALVSIKICIETTVEAIEMEYDLFNQQSGHRIVEGKTKRSMWTNTHARN
jgi:hypothetical protein